MPSADESCLKAKFGFVSMLPSDSASDSASNGMNVVRVPCPSSALSRDQRDRRGSTVMFMLC